MADLASLRSKFMKIIRAWLADEVDGSSTGHHRHTIGFHWIFPDNCRGAMSNGSEAKSKKKISDNQLVMENWIGNEYVKGRLGVARKWSQSECNWFVSLCAIVFELIW